MSVGLRVLVVDDQAATRRSIKAALEGLGHDLREAADGEVALDLIRQLHPHVVLLDVRMPVMDGLTALREIVADPVIGQTPVVMLTKQGSPEDVAEALDTGAYDYLRKPFEPVELRARVAAAGRLGLLLAQLRDANAELQMAATTDQLTGLANRRQMDRAMRDSADPSLAVVMADVDHFKQVNDTWGHPTGDAVLRTVASRLRRSLRTEDVIGRWGGEEFLIMLPGAGGDDALEVCERLLDAVRAPLMIDDGPEQVTVSLGVAARSTLAEDVEDLLRRADAALYRAKADGRDRVAVA